MKIVSKTDNYQTGDCFEFKERIRDFGVVYIKENRYHDETQLDFFPVKLDTTKVGIEKFKYGTVYLSSFINYTNPDGKTEGFMTYFFLDQKDFRLINKLFAYVGAIRVKENYRNVTGGTMAENYDDFRYQLDRWDQMFGQNAYLVPVTNILR